MEVDGIIEYFSDAGAWAVGIGMYLVIVVLLWKVNIGEGWSMMNKVIITICMLPICYASTKWQLRR